MITNSINKYNASNYLFQLPNNQNHTTTFGIKFKNNIQKDTISFKSTKPKVSSRSYEDFCSEIKQKYPNESIGEILQMHAVKSENFLGRGREGAVYEIDGLSDFAVKIPIFMHENQIKIKNDFKKIRDTLGDKNFGQAILENSDGILILKKVSGTPHGMVADKILKQQYRIFPEDAKLFLDKLQTINSFPIKSFINFAKKIKFLNDNSNYCIDVREPNNLLVDTEQKEFNIIDLINKYQKPGLDLYKGDIHTMINFLLSPLQHTEILKQLSDEEKPQLIKISKEIISKCKTASQKVGLPLSPMSPQEFYDDTMNLIWHKKGSVHKGVAWSKRYEDFAKLYEDVIPKTNKKIQNVKLKLDFENYKKQLSSLKEISEGYLSFLLTQGILTKENILEIAKLVPEKIPEFDLKYFSLLQIPLTDFDDKTTLEIRRNNTNISQVEETDEEFTKNKNSIIESQFKKIESTPKEKKMLLVRGIPCSGKNFYIDNYYKNDYYIADTDYIKTLFPSYPKAKLDGSLHKVARIILHNYLITKAIETGTNIAIPTTGYSEYIQRLSELAKKHNYEVELVYIDTSQNTANQRSKKRFNKTGKYIDPFLIAIKSKLLEKEKHDFDESNLIDKKTIINI